MFTYIQTGCGNRDVVHLQLPLNRVIFSFHSNLKYLPWFYKASYVLYIEMRKMHTQTACGNSTLVRHSFDLNDNSFLFHVLLIVEKNKVKSLTLCF